MKRSLISFGAAAFGAVIGLSAPQPGAKVNFETRRAFTLPDGVTVELEGVCRYDETSVDCWDLNGHEDRDLTAATEQFYGSDASRLPIWFHRKGRLVAFKSFQTESGTKPSTASGMGFGTAYKGGTLDWMQISSGLHDKTTSLVIPFQQYVPEAPVRIALKAGSVGRGLGRTVQFTGVKAIGKVPYSNSNAPSPDKQWLYSLRFTGHKVALDSIGCSLLDLQGNPIRYADANGNIVPDPPPSPSGVPQPDRPGVWDASGTGFSTDALHGDFMFNVNPAQVGFIEITGSRAATVRFKDIPLDPK